MVANVFPSFDHSNVQWSSSAPEIVSVTQNGTLTANLTGSAVIAATVDEICVKMYVSVYQPVSAFSLPEEIWIVAKDTSQLIPFDIVPADAELNLEWCSSDPSVAPVDENGFVNGRVPGDATITVTDANNVCCSVLVHVCYPVSAVSFDFDSISLPITIKRQLIAHVTTNTETYENKLITFSSSDDNIVTINPKGVVCGIASGTAIVTATASNGKEASIIIEVSSDSQDITILPSDLTIIEAEAFAGTSCKAVILPEGCVSIGNRAFADCAELYYIRVPVEELEIEDDAFEGCQSVYIDRMI